MDSDRHRDEFGFVGPLPVSSNLRRIPEPGFPTGPEPGASLPDFALVDQTGRAVSLHADRAGAPAVVVFLRSVVWSPACLTQLAELQDALPALRAAGVEVYAVSYDEREALADFARARRIGFPLLADPGSAVIWRLGLLNDLLAPADVPFYGVAHPGAYLLDATGAVRAKFFYRHPTLRVSAETLLDAATGRIALGEHEPRAHGGDDGVRVTAFLRGGRGVLRSGAVRHLVVRFALADGVSLVAPPAPPGLTAPRVEVSGPEGLHVEAPQLRAAPTLPGPGRAASEPGWRDDVDLVVPVWASTELVGVTEPVARERATLELTLHYQTGDAGGTRAPRAERLALEVPIDGHHVPRLRELDAKGHHPVAMDSARHFQRLVRRSESGEGAG